MAAFRCIGCDIDYPPHGEFDVCHACQEKTVYAWNHDPQPDYATTVEWKIENRRANQVVPIEPIPNSHATIIEYKGLLWVAHALLIDSGYRNLCTFDVVQIAGKFYELQGHVGKQVEGLPEGAWWIEEIDPDQVLAPIHALPEASPDTSTYGSGET